MDTLVSFLGPYPAEQEYVGRSMKDDKSITVAICGSMKVIEAMIDCANELETMGIASHLPTLNEPVDYATLPENKRAVTKSKLIRDHIEKIYASDAVLIYNVTLGDRHNYIGANSFLEMGFAFAAGKPIYLFTDIPTQPNTEEIAGMLPICLNGNLELIQR